MQRLGTVARLKPEKVASYIELHAATWPSVLARIKDCNLENYSIFHKELPGGEHWLFSYVEYVGDDFRPTWRGWPPIRRCSVGGPSASPASIRSRSCRPARFGHRWSRSSFLSSLFTTTKNSLFTIHGRPSEFTPEVRLGVA